MPIKEIVPQIMTPKEQAESRIKEIKNSLRSELKYGSPMFQAFAFHLRRLNLESTIAALDYQRDSQMLSAETSEKRQCEAQLGALNVEMLKRRVADTRYLLAEAKIMESFDEIAELTPYFEKEYYEDGVGEGFVFDTLKPLYDEIMGHAAHSLMPAKGS